MPVTGRNETKDMASIGASTAEGQNTLYVRNLNEKIHPDKLRHALQAAFGQFGKVLEVIIPHKKVRRPELYGQAWVVFAKQKHAAIGLEAMQGFELFDKPLQLAYARKKSDVIAKKDGTFKPRVRVKKQPKPKAVEADHDEGNGTENGGAGGALPGGPGVATAAGAAATAVAAAVSLGEANKILFARNIPKDSTKEEVQQLFAACEGLKEIRLIAVKGVAFIEFDDVRTAGMALSVAGTAEIRGSKLNITFAAK